jgi:hypothetical protein
MFMRAGIALTLFVAALGAAVPAGADTAPVTSSGGTVDRTPTTRVLNVADEHTSFFSTTFDADAGESRFVSTGLVVMDAKGTSPNEIFLGVTLLCTSPSGQTTEAEGGRNVWPGGGSFSITVDMMLNTDVAGSYTCQSDVMMCDPGACNGSPGTGKVKIVTRKMNPKEHSFLLVTAALPAWAQAIQEPPGGDQLVAPGKSLVLTETFDVSEDGGQSVEVGAMLSMTNCIEDDYPTACGSAKSVRANGSAKVRLSITAKQLPTEQGVTCATKSGNKATGTGTWTITWQQHHAVDVLWVPDFELSQAAGCGNSVQVQVTVKVLKGNSLVVESGDKAKWSSLVYVVPGDAFG